MASTNIYVLRLTGGRYYVGKSNDVTSRFQQHLAGTGSAWTRKYRPIALEREIKNASPFEEDKITKELMAKHGIEKVRGGSYVQEELSEFHVEALKMELWGATDKCTTCGRQGHFARNCYARKDVTGKEIDTESESDDDSSRSSGSCYCCGRSGHYAADCYASTRVSYTARGDTKSVSCYRCGRAGHKSPDCYASSHVNGKRLYG